MNPAEIPEVFKDVCSCRAAIVWALTEAGKPMPVEQHPGDLATGKLPNLKLTIVEGKLRCQIVKAELAYGNDTLHLAHWLRCPDSQHHRRPKGGRAWRRTIS